MCVAAYGEEKEFPAFFTERSGFKVPYNVSSPRQAAQMIRKKCFLNVESHFYIVSDLTRAKRRKQQECIQ